MQKALEEIYTYPLRQTAIDTLNRQLRSGIADDKLAELVVELRAEGRLCIIHEEEQQQEPRRSFARWDSAGNKGDAHVDWITAEEKKRPGTMS